IGPFVGELGRAEPVDRFRSRRLSDREQLVADFVDGLIPRDSRPLAVDEFHRIFETSLAVHKFAHGCTFRAVRAAIDRAIPARLLADPDAVRDPCRDGAADRAMGTDILTHLDRRTCGRRRAGFGFAHAPERQYAQGREPAGNETRAAQERAAVETAVAVAGE